MVVGGVIATESYFITDSIVVITKDVVDLS